MRLFHKIRLGDRKGGVVTERTWRVGHIPVNPIKRVPGREGNPSICSMHVKLRFCTGFFITAC